MGVRLRSMPVESRLRVFGSRFAVRCLCMLAVTAIVPSVCFTGCTRNFFRQSADRDVGDLLTEKNLFEQWQIENFYIYPSPLARFADWTNPDRPPMPPDDPAAWLLSPKPQWPRSIEYIEGTGYIDVLAAWDAENRAKLGPEMLPPPKPENKPTAVMKPIIIGDPHCGAMDRLKAWGERKEPFLITLDQAMELGLFNSREFQNRRETLYLTALPVSFQRFAFLPQFEATNETIREWGAKNSSVGKQNRWISGTDLSMSKQFTTGALLLLQLANTTVINLTGPNKHTISTSAFVLDLSQPLLQGGGRAVTLEPLTQAERDLLYDIRDFAHFHREFYVSIAAGGAPQSGGGGVFSVQGQTSAFGYIPTLQRRAQVQFEQRNEDALKKILALYQSYAEAGSVARLQVDEVETNLLRAQITRLGLQSAYADGLDQFKVQLGLPTDLPLELDHGPVQPMENQFNAYDRVQSDYNLLIDELTKVEKEAVGPRELRTAIMRMLNEAALLKGTQIQKDLLERLKRWAALNSVQWRIADFLTNMAPLPQPASAGTLLRVGSQMTPAQFRLAELREQRKELQAKIDQFERDEKPVPPELRKQFREVNLELDAGTLEIRLGLYELEPWRLEFRVVRFGPLELRIYDPVRQQRVRTDTFRRVLNSLSIILEDVRVERYNQLSETWSELPPVRLNGLNLLEGDEDPILNLVGQTALLNRLDLMNQRGLLVDAWRQIAVSANSLLGVFNVRYNMEVLTPPAPAAQPLNFEGERSRHQLFLNTELPLVRELQRNNYRATLIAYQRARRALMQSEDSILFQVRQEIRQLRQLAESYETQKRAVGIAYLRVEIALETFQQPPAPGEQRDAATAAAALTQQILNAQRDLVGAQNSMMAIWVNYITTRMRLYRDLELLQVDSRGVWIDEFPAKPDPEVQPDRRP